jgi:DNA-dependent RNA polymerase auxiliary subunit epsilon
MRFKAGETRVPCTEFKKRLAIDDDRHRKLRLYVVENELYFVDVVKEMVDEYLAKRGVD